MLPQCTLQFSKTCHFALNNPPVLAVLQERLWRDVTVHVGQSTSSRAYHLSVLQCVLYQCWSPSSAWRDWIEDVMQLSHPAMPLGLLSL